MIVSLDKWLYFQDIFEMIHLKGYNPPLNMVSDLVEGIEIGELLFGLRETLC